VIIAFYSSSTVRDPQINGDLDFDRPQFVVNRRHVATRFSLVNDEYRSRMSNDFSPQNRAKDCVRISGNLFGTCIVDLGHCEKCFFNHGGPSHHTVAVNSYSGEISREHTYDQFRA